MNEAIIVGGLGLIGVLLLIFYYALNNKIEDTGNTSREFSLLESRSAHNTKEIKHIKNGYIRKDLCLSTRENIEIKLDNMSKTLEDVQQKVNKIYENGKGEK